MIEWRGPAPYYFVVLPHDEADLIAEVAQSIIYWGCVPVMATIGDQQYKTAMFPREGSYRLPVRKDVRLAEGLDVGDQVAVELHLDV